MLTTCPRELYYYWKGTCSNQVSGLVDRRSPQDTASSTMVPKEGPLTKFEGGKQKNRIKKWSCGKKRRRRKARLPYGQGEQPGGWEPAGIRRTFPPVDADDLRTLRHPADVIGRTEEMGDAPPGEPGVPGTCPYLTDNHPLCCSLTGWRALQCRSLLDSSARDQGGPEQAFFFFLVLDVVDATHHQEFTGSRTAERGKEFPTLCVGLLVSRSR